MYIQSKSITVYSPNTKLFYLLSVPATNYSQMSACFLEDVMQEAPRSELALLRNLTTTHLALKTCCSYVKTPPFKKILKFLLDF